MTVPELGKEDSRVLGCALRWHTTLRSVDDRKAPAYMPIYYELELRAMNFITMTSLW